MRRKDRQCQDEAFFDLVFHEGLVIYVAFLDGDFPCCLPFNFARVGGEIYIHSAKEGKKLDLIRKNPNVSFALAVDVEIDPQNFTTYYKSVCGRGQARILTDKTAKGAALDAIGAKYDALCQRPSPPENVNRVEIIAIEILELSGKKLEKKAAGH